MAAIIRRPCNRLRRLDLGVVKCVSLKYKRPYVDAVREICIILDATLAVSCITNGLVLCAESGNRCLRVKAISR
jgi:hypothetical protein